MEIFEEGQKVTTRSGCSAIIDKVLHPGDQLYNGRTILGRCFVAGRWYQQAWFSDGAVHRSAPSAHDLIAGLCTAVVAWIRWPQQQPLAYAFSDWGGLREMLPIVGEVVAAIEVSAPHGAGLLSVVKPDPSLTAEARTAGWSGDQQCLNVPDSVPGAAWYTAPFTSYPCAAGAPASTQPTPNTPHYSTLEQGVTVTRSDPSQPITNTPVESQDVSQSETVTGEDNVPEVGRLSDLLKSIETATGGLSAVQRDAVKALYHCARGAGFLGAVNAPMARELLGLLGLKAARSRPARTLQSGDRVVVDGAVFAEIYRVHELEGQAIATDGRIIEIRRFA